MFQELGWVDAISSVAAGGAGVSTATGLSFQSLPVAEIGAIALTYTGVASPATTDVTVTLKGSGGVPDQVLLVKSNSGANAVVYPRIPAVDAAGAAIAASYTNFIGSGRIQIDVAQADVGCIVTARVYFKK